MAPPYPAAGTRAPPCYDPRPVETQQLIAAIASGVGTSALVAGAVLGTRAFRLARLLGNTPPTPIAELEPGLNEVRGVVHGDGDIESPLSRRACLYWRMIVEQRRRNRWETLVDKRQTVRTWLDDGGGRVALFPDEADVIVTSPARGTGGIFGFPSAELSEVLDRLGEAPEGLVGPYLRYREEVIAGGDRVHAVGRVAAAADGWEMHADGDLYVVSDRDEAEVVRGQERIALRWAGVAILGALGVAWGVLNGALGAF